jgi:hypothetical protein
MSGGLSTASFVSGAAQGFSLAEGMKDRQANREMQSAKLEQDKKLFNQNSRVNDMKIKSAERQELMEKFKVVARQHYENGTELGDDFYEMFAPLGIGKMRDPNRRDDMIDAGVIFKRAQDSGDWGNPDLLGAANVVLKDQLTARAEKDGLQREITGARQLKDGRVALELSVTNPDGSIYKAPMTRNGTADANDSVITLDEAKIQELAEVTLTQANAAYLAEKAADDPKAFIDSLYYGVTAKRLAPQSGADGYDTKEVYDKATGRKVVAAIDKKTGKVSHYLGGVAAPSDKDQKDEVINLSELFKARNKVATSTDFLDDAARSQAIQAVNDNAVALYGATVDQIEQAQNLKRQAGDYGPLTKRELNAFVAGSTGRQGVIEQPLSTDAQNPGLSSAQAQPAPVQSAPPKPKTEEERQIAELEAKAMDPVYPNNARDKFQQQADELKAKITKRNTPTAPPRPGKRSKQEIYQEEMQFLQARLSTPGITGEEAAKISQEMANLSIEANTSVDKNAGLASF